MTTALVIIGLVNSMATVIVIACVMIAKGEDE